MYIDCRNCGAPCACGVAWASRRFRTSARSAEPARGPWAAWPAGLAGSAGAGRYRPCTARVFPFCSHLSRRGARSLRAPPAHQVRTSAEAKSSSRRSTNPPVNSSARSSRSRLATFQAAASSARSGMNAASSHQPGPRSRRPLPLPRPRPRSAPQGGPAGTRHPGIRTITSTVCRASLVPGHRISRLGPHRRRLCRAAWPDPVAAGTGLDVARLRGAAAVRPRCRCRR
jgi:hypothetical protein